MFNKYKKTLLSANLIPYVRCYKSTLKKPSTIYLASNVPIMHEQLGLIEASQQIQAGELDPKKYLRACFARANELEPELHAFVNRASLESLLQNLGEINSGPLWGIPVAVKDIINTVELPTTNGSPIYVNHQPTSDAEIIRLIKQLGGLVFGKTVTTEFAWRNPGPTVNPWNPLHTPGGSSSGSAAVVAKGIVPLSLGSQTLGSIIRPAAYCGVVGFKASYGVIPTSGVFPFSHSLDHVGLFTRSVVDMNFAFNLLTQRFNQATSQQSPRIGILKTPFDAKMSDEQARTLELTVLKLTKVGISVQAVELPLSYASVLESIFCVIETEAAIVHQHHLENHSTEISEHIHALVKNGSAHTPAQYSAALQLQAHLKEEIKQYFQGVDVLLTAPAAGEAPLGLQATGDPIFCSLWSFLGLPAITMPVARSKNDLPLGIQLVGQLQQDTYLLELAKVIESALASG